MNQNLDTQLLRAAVLCATLIAAAASPGQAVDVDKLCHLQPGEFQTDKYVGNSVDGRRVHAYYYGSGEKTILFMAAFHGDEPQSAVLLQRFSKYLAAHPEKLKNRTAIVVLCVNPDGLANGTRQNSAGVDINRNFSIKWEGKTKAQAGEEWGGVKSNSEPETKIVSRLVLAYRPAHIVSIHYPLNQNNWDGAGPAKAKAEALANAMHAKNEYPVTASVGYPTPGSFGKYAGLHLKIPTVTLELNQADSETHWNANRDALLAALRFPEKYP